MKQTSIVGKRKWKLNWSSFFALIIVASVMGIIGVGLPKTINFINNFPENSFYGYWASYPIICLLFYGLTYGIKPTKQK